MMIELAVQPGEFHLESVFAIAGNFRSVCYGEDFELRPS
jgi:hypothetical protein